MACQSCLEKRKKLLGAIRLPHFQAMVPLSTRESVTLGLKEFNPSLSYPVEGKPQASGKTIRFYIDLAIPTKRLAVFVGFHNLPIQQSEERSKMLRSKGWTILDFPQKEVDADLAGTIAKIRAFL